MSQTVPGKRNFVILGAIGAAIVLLVVFAIVLRPRSKALILKEQRISYSHFVTKLPESGFIMRPRVQTIAALVGGNIGMILVRAGDRVSQGQLIATIINPQVESAYHSAEAAYRSAAARVMTVRETNAALPAQNESSVTQAKAALENAKTALNQSRQDAANGAQSGLGYGGSSAEEQRLTANAAVARADTELREAQRLFDANKDLYASKAISRDGLEASRARYDGAKVAADQAHRQRDLTIGQLGRTQGLLHDRARAAEDSVRQTEAALAAAKAVAGQSRQGDVAAAIADASRAQSEYAFARDQFARTEIHAPFAGVIATVAAEPADSLRPLAPGDTVAPSAPLFSMAAGGGFIARAKVDEQDVSRVAPGQRAIVSGEDFGGATLRGHITAVSPVAQRSDDPSSTSRQVLTTVALEQTLPFLRDGMSVDVDIITVDIAHAIVVPTEAITREKSKAFVYVSESGKAKRRDVRTASSNDSQTVIVSGLAPGDTIIAEKSAAIREGVRVEPAPSASAAAASPR